MRKKGGVDTETIEAGQVEVDPFAPTAANRVRAATLRVRLRSGKVLDEADAVWLAQYEDARADVKESRQQARGASRAHKVSFTEEEQEAASEGDTAGAAVAAGFMAREEGRRLDSLVSVGMTAMKAAFDMSMQVCGQMAARNLQLERAHVHMMEAYREHFLGRVEAEAENEILRKAKEMAENEDKDGLTQLAEQLLPLIMPQLTGAGPDDVVPKK